MSEKRKPGYSFFSPDFSREKTGSYSLSIAVGADDFSLFVQDQEKKVLACNRVLFSPQAKWEEIIPALQDHLKEFPWLQSVMKKKVALVDTCRFTLVPFSIYEHSGKIDYLALNHPLSEQDSVRDDVLKNHYSYLIYAQHSPLRAAVNAIIPGMVWRHYATPLINCTPAVNTGTYLIADVRRSWFYLIASDGKRLKFCNAFRYKSREDFVYFVLLVYKQLNLETEQTPLKLYGMIEQDSGIMQMLRRYVRYIEFGDKTVLYHDQQRDQSCYIYQFENLKNAGACE